MPASLTDLNTVVGKTVLVWSYQKVWSSFKGPRVQGIKYERQFWKGCSSSTFIMAPLMSTFHNTKEAAFCIHCCEYVWHLTLTSLPFVFSGSTIIYWILLHTKHRKQEKKLK